MVKINKTNSSTCWRRCLQRGTLIYAAELENCTATIEISMAVTQKTGNQSIQLYHTIIGHIIKEHYAVLQKTGLSMFIADVFITKIENNIDFHHFIKNEI